jgi:superoxide reductase
VSNTEFYNHVPQIELPIQIRSKKFVPVKIHFGSEGHPNTMTHHIKWISLFFKPDYDENTYSIGSWEFTPHRGCPFIKSRVEAEIQFNKGGTLYALSHCNVHGLWESSKYVEVI